MQTVNVICMKWGTKYGPEYVNVLARMVARHLKRPHRFVCFTERTDGIDPGVECKPLPVCNTPNRPEIQAWRKISLFTPELGLSGPTLFLDLDVAITDSLDPFFDFEPGRFCIIHNWTHPDRRVGNSSVFRFEACAHPYVFEEYNRDPDKVADTFRNEQMYVTDRIDAKEGVLWWPAEWCKSFKKHCLPKGILKLFVPSKLPQGCRIVVFHGDPNPPEASRNWRYKGHHFMLPARWVAEHWR
jgi:hypothetical protein